MFDLDMIAKHRVCALIFRRLLQHSLPNLLFGMGRNKKKTRQAPTTSTAVDDRDYLLERADLNNPRFSAYYKAQNIVPEDDWDALISSMRQHLPTTFRVAGSRQIAQSLNSIIKEVHVPSLSDIEFEDQRIPPPVQIPWFPDGLAWQFNVPKKVLRKQPEFKKFHSFLVFETEIGNLSRQEAVSMLPPLFLDVEPHHKVMDMCAAPGSKTAQILEALHANDTIISSVIPTGLLLANDSDHKRTHLLIHQSARLPSPALMVTNLDASNYPVIKIPAHNRQNSQQLLFDRILCDVPCSGDGTMRKNIGIWKSWQPGDGNGLHSLQVRILQRAMKLLERNGRIVYSTCSLNPVENEAVIAEALSANPDFELVDVSGKFPDLRRWPGLTSWRPTVDRGCEVTFGTFDDFQNAPLDPPLKAKLSEGHFPPMDVEKMNLHRCLRIYPHLQDTGGFFIAVLKRKRPDGKLTAIPKNTTLVDESSCASERKRAADETGNGVQAKKPRLHHEEASETMSIDIPNGSRKSEGTPEPVTKSASADVEDFGKGVGAGTASQKQGGGGSFKENPYTFLSSGDAILQSCIERLHLTSDFPSSNILVRNPEGEPARSLYLVNDIVKTIIQNNDYRRIRLTAAGTKVMTKQEAGKGSNAQFRVLGEGLPVVLPFIDASTIITSDLPSLRVLLTAHYPLISSFGDPFRETIQDRPMGSHIIKFPPSTAEGIR
ncbi:hypothetical protein AX15_003037 [Amanita polypyramis BW_CC]|nr:hypothetical protein AX15_003037 [Amanita polypyramis BW_CC]